MITLGDIFRQYGPAYREKFSERIPLCHHVAMRVIEQCRTEALGGHVYTCPQCATTRYSYHSCRNRHCPTCQQDQAQSWLNNQQQFLLPVPYFLVTFTLPAQLRTVTRENQRHLYSLLFRRSATVLLQLAADPRFLGGQIGLVGVLQTWTRDLRYDPHIHYLVPAGALSSSGSRWLAATGRFLVHTKPLAKLFRGKVRAGLRQLKLEKEVASETWSKPWVVDCRAVLRLSLQTMDGMERQVKRLATAIAEQVDQVPQTLESIPGIGPVFAAGISSEIGDIGRFDADEAKVAKFAGFTWGKHQSGQFVAEETPLTRQGNAYLRYSLVESANAVRMHTAEYRASYDRNYHEVRQHQHKRALVLTARKLVGLVVRLLATNQPYHARRPASS